MQIIAVLLMAVAGFTFGMNFGAQEFAKSSYETPYLHKLVEGRVVEMDGRTYKFNRVEVQLKVEEVKK